MLSESEVFAALTRLAEGHLSPDEWCQWWRKHWESVKNAVKPGEFLKLKPIGKWSDIEHAHRSHRATCGILESRGIAFSRSERYEKELVKFQEMTRPRAEFDGEVLHFIETKLNASYDDRFLDRMYQAYEAAGHPDDLSHWIKERVPNEFLCVGQRPRWLSDPEWPIRDGIPGVFIAQFNVPENEVTRTRYVWDGTIYVFGFRTSITERGFQIDHIVVFQEKSSDSGEY